MVAADPVLQHKHALSERAVLPGARGGSIFGGWMLLWRGCFNRWSRSAKTAKAAMRPHGKMARIGGPGPDLLGLQRHLHVRSTG